MELASPARWVWLGILIPVVLIYLLKTRLQKRAVPTLLFWDQLFDEKRRRSWWQRFRHWASLLLQLIFVAGVVAALVDPLWPGQKEDTRQVVIVLDNSASMAAVDADGRSRWEDAIEQAVGVTKSMRDGDELALITAGGEPNVLVGLTDFFPAVAEAIEEVELTQSSTNVEQATHTARQLVQDQRRRKIIVISDFAFEQAQRWTDDDDLQTVRVGDDLNNIGITKLAVRRSLVDPIGFAAMLNVRNFSDEPIETRLTVKLGEDLIDAIPLNLEPEAAWAKTIVGASAEGGDLQIELDADDSLVIDNEAAAKVAKRNRIPVILVTPTPSVYLRSVFQAIPLVDLEVTNTLPETAPPGGFLVLNRLGVDGAAAADFPIAGIPRGSIPAGRIPPGNVLVIAPNADTRFWKVGPPLEEPIVAKQDTKSALMPHVRLLNVALPGARDLRLIEPDSRVASRAAKLIEGPGGETLMASVIDEGNRIIVLSADLDDGDLPLRIAFPVLITNSVNWFLNREDEIATPIAGSLCDEGESDLRSQLTFESDRVEAAGNHRRSVWFYVVCGAFALVLLEWFLYQRRVVA